MPELVTPHWINRLVRRDERGLTAVIVSDSQADGFSNGDSAGVKDFRDTWPGLLADTFGDRVGVPVGKWIPADTPNAVHANYEFVTTSWDSGATHVDRTGDSNGVPGSVWLNNGSPSSQSKSLTWDLDDSTVAVDVILGGYPEYGTSDVTITITPVGGTPVDHVVTPDTHVWRWSTANAVGIESVMVSDSVAGVQVYGIVEYEDISKLGFHVYNFGFANKPAADFALYTDATLGTELPTLIAEIAPDVVIIDLAGNDYAQGYTPAQLQASLETIVGNVLVESPLSDVFFLDHDYADQTGAVAPWADYRAAIVAAATATGTFVQTTQYTTPQGSEGLFTSDGVHYTLSGARSVSDAVMPALYPR